MGFTHRPLSSSFLWFMFRILEGNPKKELLRGLWVEFGVLALGLQALGFGLWGWPVRFGG